MNAPAGDIVAAYDYVGPNGSGLLYQKVKYRLPDGGKTFRQRRPRGSEWDWKLGDVSRVLYRLPELLAADPEETVFFVEGEKDADRLAALGLVATTAGGASDWRPSMAESLRGRDVVILPDNDAPGRKHATIVGRSVREVALRVRMVDLPDLPDAGDVSDWLDAGNTIDDLLGLVRSTGEWEPPANGEVHAAAEPQAPRGRRAPDLVQAILDRADDPWITLALGGEIATVATGGIVIIMGPSGAGKSSLTAGLMVAHARESGPAIYLSRELPDIELGARIVGMQTDSSWKDVLRGRVPREFMERALALPQLIVVDRKNATLDTLERELHAARAEDAHRPILVAIDYTQIIQSTHDDPRARVSETMERTDDLARKHRAVVLVISQMSRVNARAARTGESLGAETTDGGAESAAIERYASLTLTIGGFSQPTEDGSQTAQLSIGKYRMGVGDRVIPMRYEGRTGRWRVDGDARAATEVRAERAAAENDAKVGAAVRAMRDRAASAPEPITREDLRAAAAVSKTMAKAAIEQMLKSGELVEVQKKRPRANAWLVWTADRAAAAGLPIVPREGVSTAARPMNSNGSTAAQL